MFKQSITRLVVGFALIAASCAWSGWVFLHSVGDPHRSERIATAILDSADARTEIAGPITDQLLDQVGFDPGSRATVRDAVASVLADPTVVENFIAAFGSAQANALGVDDPRPTTIDVGALTTAVRERLAPTQPEIADQIPTITDTIDLPTARTGAVRSLRDLAERWTTILGLGSFAVLVAMMIVGDRRSVLRSFGFWAIMTGAFWAIGPRLVPWLAHQSAPDADALIKATVTAVVGPITAAATALVVVGVVALVVRALVFTDARTQVAAVPVFVGADYATAAVPVAGGPLMGTVLGGGQGHAAAYGLTRTDQVPTTAPAWQPQPVYQQPVYQQPPYPQPTYQQPPSEEQPMWAQQPTWAQQTVSPPPPPRSTTIDELLAAQSPVPGKPQPPPLVINPLDLPSTHDSLSPLFGPDQRPDSR